MGIRFRCHHCEHELHVKDFQAGKRGRCPECRGSFRIPWSDAGHSLSVETIDGEDAPSIDARAGFRDGGEHTQDGSTKVRGAANSARPRVASNSESAKPSARASTPSGSISNKPLHKAEDQRRSGEALASVGELAARAQQIPDEGWSGVTTHSAGSELDGSESNTGQGGPTSDDRSLSADKVESGEATLWYVRPPSGGQYGPATTDVFESWLAEHRVSADSLVWRSGWSDWLPASTALPKRFERDTVVAPVVTYPASDSMPPISAVENNENALRNATASGSLAASPSLSEKNRLARRQRRKRNYMLTLAILSVTAILLVGALIVALVVQGNHSS